ncbi:MAG: S49 family peptidase [Balneolales bacterium]
MKYILSLSIFRLLAVIILISVITVQSFGNPGIGFERYYERTEFLMASPGTMNSGLYGYDNPAMLKHLHQPDFSFYWTSDTFLSETGRWGGFLGVPGSSFSFVQNNLSDQKYRDYRISFGGGSEAAATGIALNWFHGDTGLLDLKTNITLGTIIRPLRRFSFGLTGTTTFDADYFEAVAEVAVRPLSTPILTLFGDIEFDRQTEGFFDGRWSAGAAVEALPGIRFTGRYLDHIGFTAGIRFSLGRAGFSYQSHRNNDGTHRYNSYSIRAGALDRNIFDSILRDDRQYVDLRLQGSMPYQTFRYFDDRQTFLPILQHINEAAADPAVAGMVVNTTRMQIDPAKTWEIRKTLDDFRQTGKKVIVYIERGGMNTLHLASSADYVVMDPQGGLMIPGYVSGVTYLADLLAAVGIGVDEFREMEYKSAFEALSRTDMSNADREQRQAVIDGYFDLVKENVTTGRRLSSNEFDELIDGGIALSATDLLNAGIVDRLARLTDMDDLIEEFEGVEKQRINPQDLIAYHMPRDDLWGPEHKIAVLYAHGPTMNESGIRARVLSEAMRQARNDRTVKAVVMRADSPGGDALASDLVAEELRKTAEEKPVIVSMGAVAASGGYWISMYADSIVAAPNTITGSIGVIGGWLWDDGLSENLHLHSDYVSRGTSADLSFGPTLPLIGLSLPNRALTDGERERLIDRLNDLYDDFIEKVATGRDAEFSQIKEVAAGRVWTGTQAREIGLVDELGSLYTAIELARQSAGIKSTDKVRIVEGPDTRPFSFPYLLGRASGLDTAEADRKDPTTEYLELMVEYNAVPLVILPFEYFSWMYFSDRKR